MDYIYLATITQDIQNNSRLVGEFYYGLNQINENALQYKCILKDLGL